MLKGKGKLASFIPPFTCMHCYSSDEHFKFTTVNGIPLSKPLATKPNYRALSETSNLSRNHFTFGRAEQHADKRIPFKFSLNSAR